MRVLSPFSARFDTQGIESENFVSFEILSAESRPLSINGVAPLQNCTFFQYPSLVLKRHLPRQSHSRYPCTYVEGRPERVILDGLDIEISPDAITDMALILHELTTDSRSGYCLERTRRGELCRAVFVADLNPNSVTKYERQQGSELVDDIDYFFAPGSPGGFAWT